jgi:hexosaminidase
MDNLIPKPVSVTPTTGTYSLTANTRIYIEPANTELQAIGHYFAERLINATGYAIQVSPTSGTPPKGNIHLTTENGDAALGEEGYELTVTPDGVTLRAYQPAGLFRGLQTLRQLLPPDIESESLRPGPWRIPAGTIRDMPRFAYRGAMLDVTRHFFSVEDVKRYIDLISYYKINTLHLHLSDDQGWRLEIKSWPKLTTVGSLTEVGEGSGGFYTQEQYADIVDYALKRYITIVPEFDMPGHTNAALSSYEELNCDNVAPAPYTGTEVGFSSLCIDKEITYQFVDDVVREVAAITPGPYIHIGGDEAASTAPDDYVRFIEQVQDIVQSHNKQMIGWEEIAQTKLLPTSVAQYWSRGVVRGAAEQGAKIIMSPAPKAYLDMKYDATTQLGQNWAGYSTVQDAYKWEPTTQVKDVGEESILGVEAPLWTEVILTMDDIEYMVFPRLLGHAEIGWSPQEGRNWDEYRVRLGTFAPRFAAMEIDFYKSGEVPWQ